jgi:membrane-associated protein
MTVAGYKLGKIPIVRTHFDQVVLLIIFLSILPTLREVWKAWRSGRKPRAGSPAVPVIEPGE